MILKKFEKVSQYTHTYNIALINPRVLKEIELIYPRGVSYPIILMYNLNYEHTGL